VGHWHEVAGYTIIALVFVGTMALAYLLGRKKTAVKAGVSSATMPLSSERLPLQLSAGFLGAALCWLLLVEIGTAAWYRAHESNLISGIRWSVQWPEKAPNFQKLKIDPEIRSVLRFDEGQAAAWTLTSPRASEGVGEPTTFGMQVNASRPNTISCYLYVFRW